ncbi:MAG: hypothetical protein PHQ27_02415, partial [Victivallales bacterium]|nr:hypothetical protein [Victivallales bacterium]
YCGIEMMPAGGTEFSALASFRFAAVNRVTSETEPPEPDDPAYLTGAEITALLAGRLNKNFAALDVKAEVADNDTFAGNDSAAAGNPVVLTALKLWNYVKGKADAVYAAVAHNHVMAHITDLAAALAGKADLSGADFSGTVGIGTDAPDYALDVRGTAASDGIRTAMGLDLYSVPTPEFSNANLSLATGGTNLDVGTYYYQLTYITATGETNAMLPASIITDSTHRQVTITLPISTDPRVTGRRIYRTVVNANNTTATLLAAINDNTSVTYTDNIADGGLGSAKVYFRNNTTCPGITINGNRVIGFPGTSTTGNLFVGPNVGNSSNSGGRNVGVGALALSQLSSGINNIAVGFSALSATTAGSGSVGIGYLALANNVLGGNCVGIGMDAGYGVTGTYAICIGSLSGFNTGAGNYSIAVGGYANYNSTDRAIHLGHDAGKWETSSGRLIIDSYDRGSEANSRASAIIYGMMSSTPANQILVLGGGGKVGINVTPAYTFDVPGDINTTGVYRVNGTPLDVSHLTDTTGLLDGTSWSNGTTVPDNGSGSDGDYYLNTTTYDLYHKESGAWVVIGNIKGTAGSGINFLGEYAAATTYAVNDAVTYDGSLYVSLASGNIGNQPDTSPSYWLLTVSKGDSGDPGSGGLTADDAIAYAIMFG